MPARLTDGTTLKPGVTNVIHRVEFFEAVTVFYDPLLVIVDASEASEIRHKAIGFSAGGRLLAVVHIEIEDECIRIISAWRASAAEEETYDQ